MQPAPAERRDPDMAMQKEEVLRGEAASEIGHLSCCKAAHGVAQQPKSHGCGRGGLLGKGHGQDARDDRRARVAHKDGRHWATQEEASAEEAQRNGLFETHERHGAHLLLRRDGGMVAVKESMEV